MIGSDRNHLKPRWWAVLTTLDRLLCPSVSLDTLGLGFTILQNRSREFTGFNRNIARAKNACSDWVNPPKQVENFLEYLDEYRLWGSGVNNKKNQCKDQNNWSTMEYEKSK